MVPKLRFFSELKLWKEDKSSFWKKKNSWNKSAPESQYHLAHMDKKQKWLPDNILRYITANTYSSFLPTGLRQGKDTIV